MSAASHGHPWFIYVLFRARWPTSLSTCTATGRGNTIEQSSSSTLHPQNSFEFYSSLQVANILEPVYSEEAVPPGFEAHTLSIEVQDVAGVLNQVRPRQLALQHM